ncbi:TPA: class II holin family protein [Escherichia coli]
MYIDTGAVFCGNLTLIQVLQLLDKVSPSQWVAIGVLGSLVFGLLTYLTNLYFKIKEDKRKAARGE